ncbi:MAG: hypothetical protein AAGP08_17660, partial [Pseudomonadota bacterium]
FDVVSSAISGLFDDHPSAQSTRQRLARLSDVESDLLFYLHLLKRYVSASSPDNLVEDDRKVLHLPDPNLRAAAGIG